MHPGRLAVATVTALLLTAPLAGCGRDEPQGPPTGGAPGGGQPDSSGSPGADRPPQTEPRTGVPAPQDTRFVQLLAAHSRQGAEIGKLAAGRAADPAVRRLAARIHRSQAARLAALNARLAALGRPGGTGTPEPEAEEPGLLSTEDVRALRAARGRALDEMFVTLMSEHHTAGVAMADQQQRTGRDPAVRTLARQTGATLTAELTALQGVLGSS
jgi:uncharacterized protein (DUF305 family)